MRWRGEQAFSRPVRWLLALHGGALLPLHFAGLQVHQGVGGGGERGQGGGLTHQNSD